MVKNKLQNLPIYKRPEYRVIDFLATSGLRWLSKNLPCEVCNDLKEPLSKIKEVLNESLYGDKYKTKKIRSVDSFKVKRDQ